MGRFGIGLSSANLAQGYQDLASASYHDTLAVGDAVLAAASAAGGPVGIIGAIVAMGAALDEVDKASALLSDPNAQAVLSDIENSIFTDIATDSQNDPTAQGIGAGRSGPNSFKNMIEHLKPGQTTPGWAPDAQLKAWAAHQHALYNSFSHG